MTKPDLNKALTKTARGNGKTNAGPNVKNTKPDRQPSPRTRTRIGKINVSAWLNEDVQYSLRMVQAKGGGKIQDVIVEALNDIFAKYNVPESASVYVDPESAPVKEHL